MKFIVDKVLKVGTTLVVALSACGGGEQVEKFQPTRVIAFGDEASVIETNGRKYTVNEDAFACETNRIWVQVLADTYGLKFPGQCPFDATVPADDLRVRAVADAKVSGMILQINKFIADGGFGPKDLVTVFVGMHDIKAIYESGSADADVKAKAAGALVAAQVNRIADADARVIVSTLPELGFTPYGVGEGTVNAAQLNSLTVSFNQKLLKTLTNDGHKIGLIEADKMVRSIVNDPVSSGYADVVTAACDDAKLPNMLLSDCTPDTLVDGASATTYLWAGPLQFSVSGHSNLGNLASTRALNNPF